MANSSETSSSEKAETKRSLSNAVLQKLPNVLAKHLSEALSGPSGAYTRAWVTRFVRFGPLSGIFCMFIAIACLLASLGILAGSNHKAVDGRAVPPSTHLAIFTALANLSVRYSAIQGVVVAWWVRATKGSTLSKLHWDWRSGSTLRGALTAGRHTDLLALACIFSVLVAIDGPLLQRSTSVTTAPTTDALALSVRMAPEIPRYFSGSWATPEDNPRIGGRFDSFWNRTYPIPNGEATNNVYPIVKYSLVTSVAKDWASDEPIRGVIEGCEGTCRAKLIAPALAPVACSSSLHAVNYSLDWFADSGEGGDSAPPFLSEAITISPLFNVEGPDEVIQLVTSYATISDYEICTGVLNLTTSSMKSAIGEYDIQIVNNTFTLENPGSPRIVALANNTQVDPVFHTSNNENGHYSTLAGLINLMYQQLQGYIVCAPVPTPQCFLSGSLATSFFAKPGHEICPSYEDPGPTLRIALNKLAVYVGAQAALIGQDKLEPLFDPGVFMNTTLSGFRTGSELVYDTDYWYFLGAALVDVLCIALIATTYWGWWTLGRPCSFSPLEIAKAFEAPILADCHSNSSGRDLAKAVPAMNVRYGEVKDDDGHTKVAFADKEFARPPGDGSCFDQ